MIQNFYFTFFTFFAFATQLFSTPVTSSNLRNQAPLFTELRRLQGTLFLLPFSPHCSKQNVGFCDSGYVIKPPQPFQAPGLPDWLFWHQISQIWLFVEIVGVKNIVWVFGFL